MTRPIIIIILLFSLPCFSTFAQGENSGQKQFQDFEELSLEDLLNVEVVTVSKKPEKLETAPAAVYVVTEEDIRQSGAINIPDVLRIVPGLDVMQITASHYEVNPRGFCGLTADKLLVLVDERSVYMDYFGGTDWDNFPVSLSEIKQIEVIRGPGSAMWGANAFSGVINIITKKPQEINGIHLSGEKGQRDLTYTNLLYAKSGDRLSYKVSSDYGKVNEFNDPLTPGSDRRSGEKYRINSSVYYQFRPRTEMNLDLGFLRGEDERIYAERSPKALSTNTEGFLKAHLQTEKSRIQAFWNTGKTITPELYLVETVDIVEIKYNTWDLELQHQLQFKDKHSLVFGMNYRYNNMRATWGTYVFSKQELFSAFLQEEFRPTSNLTLFLGGRYDRHPSVGSKISPKVAVLYSPWESHTFRLQAGTAFKNPSIFDTSIEALIISWPLPSPPLPPGSSTDMYLLGDHKLSSELVKSYELGYQTISENLGLGLNLFINQLEKLTVWDSLEIAEIFVNLSTGEPIIDPSTGLPIPRRINTMPTNQGKAYAWGGELNLNLKLSRNLTGLFNYSYQNLKDKVDGEAIKSSPMHKFNLGIRYKHRSGFSSNLALHHVSSIEKEVESPFSQEQVVKLDPYNLLNIRCGYFIWKDSVEIYLAVFNALDDQHQEFFTGEEISRRVSGGIKFKF